MVVDDDSGQVVSLKLVQHLHVEVRVPAEPMPSTGYLLTGRYRVPFPAERTGPEIPRWIPHSRYPADSRGPCHVVVERLVQVGRDAQVSGGH